MQTKYSGAGRTPAAPPTPTRELPPIAPAAAPFLASEAMALAESLNTRMISIKECLEFRIIAQDFAGGGNQAIDLLIAEMEIGTDAV